MYPSVSKSFQMVNFKPIPPLELVNVNPPKIHPSYPKELKARCHSSPFTKAFIVELKVMMSSVEPFSLDDFSKRREKNLTVGNDVCVFLVGKNMYSKMVN